MRISDWSSDVCSSDLGYEADNTRGNAVETAAWMKDQDFTSLRLVTATYHMPRSLLEFRRPMPDIEIVPHPVFTQHFRRSEERRVGKGWGNTGMSRWSPDTEKKHTDKRKEHTVV